MSTGTPWLIFADLETTGLGPDVKILEVGLRVVDRALATVAEASWVVPWPRGFFARNGVDITPVVQEMHDASGLWAECAEAAETIGDLPRAHQEIKREVWGFVETHAPGRLPLAGSSVRADRDWLTAFVPGLDDLLHYRIVDVSSLRILAEEWRPDVTWSCPAPLKRHRVMPDLDDTLAELTHYRDHLGFLTAPEADRG